MMLVYNLPSTHAIYQRFVGMDGSAYFVGGFGITALDDQRHHGGSDPHRRRRPARRQCRLSEIHPRIDLESLLSLKPVEWRETRGIDLKPAEKPGLAFAASPALHCGGKNGSVASIFGRERPLPFAGSKVLVEQIVDFTLGFVICGLIGLAFLPLVSARARRLTLARIEARLPMTFDEIEADRDLLRARFAVENRALEIKADEARQAAPPTPPNSAAARSPSRRANEQLAQTNALLDERNAQLAKSLEFGEKTQAALDETREALAAKHEELCTNCRATTTGRRASGTRAMRATRLERGAGDRRLPICKTSVRASSCPSRAPRNFRPRRASGGARRTLAAVWRRRSAAWRISTRAARG